MLILHKNINKLIILQVYALGRKEYGRLGLGEDGDDATVPTRIQGGDIADVKCLEVNRLPVSIINLY